MKSLFAILGITLLASCNDSSYEDYEQTAQAKPSQDTVKISSIKKQNNVISKKSVELN